MVRVLYFEDKTQDPKLRRSDVKRATYEFTDVIDSLGTFDHGVLSKERGLVPDSERYENLQGSSRVYSFQRGLSEKEKKTGLLTGNIPLDTYYYWETFNNRVIARLPSARPYTLFLKHEGVVYIQNIIASHEKKNFKVEIKYQNKGRRTDLNYVEASARKGFVILLGFEGDVLESGLKEGFNHLESGWHHPFNGTTEVLNFKRDNQ